MTKISDKDNFEEKFLFWTQDFRGLVRDWPSPLLWAQGEAKHHNRVHDGGVLFMAVQEVEREEKKGPQGS